jgi:predicted O-methyltransferase YrrM
MNGRFLRNWFWLDCPSLLKMGRAAAQGLRAVRLCMEGLMTLRKNPYSYLTLIFLLILSVVPIKVYAKDDDTSTKDYKKQYTFTTNWFTHKIPLWTQLLKEFKGRPDVSYLEIGAFEGRSVLWVLENILTNPTAKITIIDGFEENTYKKFTSNVNLSGEPNKFKIISGLSTEKLKELPSNSIDFAYIDGSGKGIVMHYDIVNTWNILKMDGIIICSRYALNGHLREALELQANDPGPYDAIDAFLKLYKPYIKVLAFEENQVIFRKIRQ